MILPVRGATTSDVIAVWSILLYHTPLSNNDANSRHDVMTSLLSDVSFFFWKRRRFGRFATKCYNTLFWRKTGFSELREL